MEKMIAWLKALFTWQSALLVARKILTLQNLLLVACVAVFVISFYAAYQSNSTGAYALASISFLAFFAAYCVGVLDYKVGGSQIALEKKVQDLQQGEEELKKIVNTLLRISLVVAEGARRFGGPREKHRAIIERHIKTIEHLVEPNFMAKTMDEVAAEIEALVAEEKAQGIEPE